MMNDVTKILIVDDSKDQCRMINDYLTTIADLEVVGIAHSGKEALSFIEATHIDLVLLDIIMPDVDGISVLESIQAIDKKRRPKVIVLSAIADDNIKNKMISLGASLYLIKPVPLNVLVDRIALIAKHVNILPTLTTIDASTIKPSGDLETHVTNVIHEVGIPAHIKGYQYLRDAIMKVIDNTSMIDNVTKQLYPSVARSFGTTPTRVERAIRHAIEVAWDRGDTEILNKFFGYTINHGKGKPTNSEFIAMISDKLRLTLKAQ
ncbi:MAG: sporulation transcription factor Spo0A [Clostridiales bacterium]|jgi:two-component system response regulator (stage 0 sporulation protein A)|nr:sporulation transcription factor Spo0A [Clostridiales bacterium]